MGAVHGVYLKYVVTGVLAGAAASTLEAPLSSAALWYACACNLTIAALFKLRWGEFLLGKDPNTGKVPAWSYLVWGGFHAPTWMYTMLHTRLGQAAGTPVASEVQDGWWIGGRYGAELGREWGGVLDLTCEFPEGCIGSTKSYKLVACWDGTPPSPAMIDEAAAFCVEARKHGHVLVHCAHGRGRSTCAMVAALVKAGLFATWEEAFAACKPRRPVIKLNAKMRAALALWQREYMHGKDE